MSGSEAESERARGAMRTAFWSWMVIIVCGLMLMIALPLAGR